MMSQVEREIVIGEITSPFGRKGEVKVLLLTDYPERFEKLEQVYVKLGQGGRVLHVEKVWYHKKGLIIKFVGIDDISSADALRGGTISIREADLMPLDEDEFYIHDIIGLEVVTTEGESLGRVKEVLRSPANDTYVTDRAMIPAVKEFVEKVDLKAGKITVKRVYGLLPEEQEEVDED